jgi:hypothetical protein
LDSVSPECQAETSNNQLPCIHRCRLQNGRELDLPRATVRAMMLASEHTFDDDLWTHFAAA